MPELIDVITGEPIESSRDAAISRRLVNRYPSRAARTTDAISPEPGEWSYLSDEKAHEFYDGSNWVSFIAPGTIVMTGRAAAQAGWLLCQGQEISRSDFSQLFSAISTAYGVGNGTTTFNLPDMRQKFPLGKSDSGIGQTLGDTGGTINHVHTGPSHSHSISITSSSVNLAHIHDLGNSASGGGGGATSSAGAHTHDLGSSGSAGSHSHSFSDTSSGPSSTVSPGSTGSVINAGSSTHTHSVSGTTGSGGSHTHDLGDSGSAGAHTHTIPNHAHDLGDSASALGSHNHTVTGSTGAEGTGNTGQANPPFVVVNYQIKV